MPRTARHLPKSAMLHIIGRGNNNVKIFRRYHDFTSFKKIATLAAIKFKYYIHHYVLMNTHYHFLLWMDDTSKLASAIKSLHVSYNQYFCNRYQYKGHLWHSRYRSIIIEDEIQWMQCGRYIELNPIHARICSHPNDYIWSSYHYYKSNKKDRLILPIMNPDKSLYDLNNYEEFILEGIDFDYQKEKKIFESALKSAY